MTHIKGDRLTGGILLLVAAVWLAGVIWTMPGGSGEGQIGPRGFPLGMGIGLGLLSLFMLISRDGEPAAEQRAKGDNATEIWALAATFGFLTAYVVLMDLFGFLIGTVAAVVPFMLLVLRKRSPRLIAVMSLGLALAIWLILGKAMGVYLPRGSLIDWF
ncbi:MAG: tripartite tricarboxylate transporter TctB family protein [Stellaceae bacterium]